MSREASSELSASEVLNEVAPTSTAPKGNESSQPVHNVLNTCQTDSESVSGEGAKTNGAIEHPEAPKPVESMQTTDASASDDPLGASVAASEPAGAETTEVKPDTASSIAEPTKPAQGDSLETKPAAEPPKPAAQPSKPVDEVSTAAAQSPKTGEKRDLEVTDTPLAGGESSTKVNSGVEQGEEHDSKKQKTEHKTNNGTNGASNITGATEAPDKAKDSSSSKKEKVKEAVKKVLPTDGPGTRTRSRTKDS
ncbi:hypothetical protein N7539_001906 [Penicillium diatomitis]|uniref:Uncharacterized protein n=1 Tax=Penicillium diatomitis TaxID=2819901 RepID=A0A9W9XII3_9EURO|nr:uncharacterized protein N7539_001906 [Penicillium diatomitis]KAJ5493160.1 hypothetical protein N7539_001906 [Penicillium diatomitis]